MRMYGVDKWRCSCGHENVYQGERSCRWYYVVCGCPLSLVVPNLSKAASSSGVMLGHPSSLIYLAFMFSDASEKPGLLSSLKPFVRPPSAKSPAYSFPSLSLRSRHTLLASCKAPENTGHVDRFNPDVQCVCQKFRIRSSCIRCICTQSMWLILLTNGR